MEIEYLITKLNEKARKEESTGCIVYKDLTENEQHLLSTYTPENVFIIYGTLAPGKPNHHLIKDIAGTWHKAEVKGKLEKDGWGADLGYNGFRHSTGADQQVIPAVVLIAEDMHANWKRLDEFEGEGYQRLLARFELSNGTYGIGYIYALK